jgi:hypothetical protein
MTSEVRCLSTADAASECDEDAFVFDAPDIEPSGYAGIVLPSAGEARAAALLEAGAARVLLGEAALLDSELVTHLAERYGAERIGLYVPARRMSVSWSFDTTSNADFKVVTPSLCEPSWEVLRANGGGTGTFAGWWIGEMRKRGATEVLVRVDMRDDADLNLCAGLVEDLGEALWLGPLHDVAPKLDDWIAYGQLRRLVLPAEQYHPYRMAALAALSAANNPIQEAA